MNSVTSEIMSRLKSGTLFGTLFVSPSQRIAFSICADCPRSMWGEWYVTKRAVWEKAWPGTSLKSAFAPMPWKHFLCIGCLERRLKRKLTCDDFDMRRSHNKPRPELVMSRRFRDRVQRVGARK
jgi:hypothetical protein